MREILKKPGHRVYAAKQQEKILKLISKMLLCAVSTLHHICSLSLSAWDFDELLSWLCVLRFWFTAWIVIKERHVLKFLQDKKQNFKVRRVSNWRWKREVNGAYSHYLLGLLFFTLRRTMEKVTKEEGMNEVSTSCSSHHFIIFPQDSMDPPVAMNHSFTVKLLESINIL